MTRYICRTLQQTATGRFGVEDQATRARLDVAVTRLSTLDELSSVYVGEVELHQSGIGWRTWISRTIAAVKHT